MKTRLIAVAVLAAAGTAVAQPKEYTFNWNFGDTSHNDRGGRIDSITSTYNEKTERFTWDVTFSDQITDGYTLVVSPGDNPKGITGELAMIYLDASEFVDGGSGDIVTSVYGYNGQNGATSHIDGDASTPGTQTPGRIQTSIYDSFVNGVSVVDNVDGSRTFSLDIDASVIQDAFPPPPGGDWTGVAFGEEIGVWFHPFKNLDTTYFGAGDAGDGFLNTWSGRDGWLDLRDQGTSFVIVPLPTSAALAAVGLGIVGLRRRR
ncbi:MAG: hypothetical protein AAFX79_01315 [Planctomycetota bacterium]